MNVIVKNMQTQEAKRRNEIEEMGRKKTGSLATRRDIRSETSRA